MPALNASYRNLELCLGDLAHAVHEQCVLVRSVVLSQGGQTFHLPGLKTSRVARHGGDLIQDLKVPCAVCGDSTNGVHHWTPKVGKWLATSLPLLNS